MNTQNKIGLAGVVAVVVAALIGIAPDLLPQSNEEPAVEPEVMPSVLYGPITVFLGTHPTTDRAGTDSNIGLELYSGGQILSSLTFNGGCCDNDSILERGSPVSAETFAFSDTRLPDAIRLTLMTPTGNGGHWRGTSVQIKLEGYGSNLCASEDVNWLTASRTNVILPLDEC